MQKSFMNFSAIAARVIVSGKRVGALLRSRALPPALAAVSILPQGFPKGANVTFCDALSFAQNLINFALYYLLFPLGIIMIIVGGVMYIMYGAQPSLQGQGKKLITNAVTGIAIVLLSWVIVNTIFNVLAGTQQPNGFPYPWYQISCQ